MQANFKIDKFGQLHIERRPGHGFVSAWCGFKPDELCGHQCALFGEPERVFDSEEFELEICHIFVRGRYTDERE